MHIEIKNWNDLEVLKKLDRRNVSGRDVIIESKYTEQSSLPFILNAIPVIYQHLKNKKHKIKLINIDPCFFKIKTDLKNITSLVIEPNNTCNLFCAFCRTGRRERKTESVLAFKTFKNVVDQFPVLPQRIELFGRGEPFLNKDLFRMIQYLKKGGCPYVATSTNGHFLNTGNIHKLVSSRLDMLLVSLDSLRKKTYQLMRRGGNFDLVMDNLTQLSYLKSKGVQRPHVCLQFIITRHNEGEIDLIKRFAAKLKFGIEFRSLSSDDENLMPLNPRFRRNENFFNQKLKPVNFCAAPWKRMVISCEGKITMCPKSLNPGHFDMEKSPLLLGDTQKAGLDEIWNGKAYALLRKQMLEDKHAIGCPARCPNPDFSLNKKICKKSRP